MDGVIVINKPAGLTSSAVVLRVKRMLGARKVGHTGTLDPMATGVLPLCINEGTKLAPFFLHCERNILQRCAWALKLIPRTRREP